MTEDNIEDLKKRLLAAEGERDRMRGEIKHWHDQYIAERVEGKRLRAQLATLRGVVDLLPDFIEEACDMAGWASPSPGTNAAYREFSAKVKGLQDALNRLGAP